MAKPFNGYPSWSAWNVSLWINNDEGLYNWAKDSVKGLGYKKAAEHMHRVLVNEKTPDGAKYSARAIRLAIRGMKD